MNRKTDILILIILTTGITYSTLNLQINKE